MKRALDVQVGGGHYKTMPIQPVEFSQRNKLGFCEGNVVKYITRHRTKNGIEDVLKARHYIDLLIQLEYPEWEPGKEVRRTTKSTTRRPKRRKTVRRATRRVVKPKIAGKSTKATAKK